MAKTVKKEAGEQLLQVGRLRSRKCQLNHLHRADGSVAYAQGDTVVWASVFGPGDLKMSRQLGDKATVDIVIKAAKESQSKLGNLEGFLRDACSDALLLKEFPRTQIAITVQELQNDGSLYSAAVNSSCLALLDAGLPMSHVYAGVTVAVEGGSDRSHAATCVLDPNSKQEAAASAILQFVFVQMWDTESRSYTGRSSSTRTTGSFSLDTFHTASAMARWAAVKIFDFYRAALARKFSTEENTCQVD